ncbi:MAG TPA: CHAT domain-containing tetratricopeptide repeat protein [Pyrinomonadaceae bacterium]|nr:CHAT domain-containing tetratricopeptide repeat protein [Pyrinomonadaceae bacterium]
MNATARRFIAFVVSTSLVLGLAVVALSHETSRPTNPGMQQTDQAGNALQEGRRLLKRGKADQALGRLQTALSLYTASNNRKGIAAAQNELGDLYLRQGQNKTALDHYQLAYDALTGALGQEQKNAAAAGAAARMVPSAKAGEAVDTAASASDTGFNAKLLLAKIGDTNYQLGELGTAAASYGLMNPTKPESAAKKAGGMFGKLAPSILVGNATDSAAIGSAAGAVGGALVAKNELEQYRTSIIYMTYELGMGRIAFAENDLETARKHFQNAEDAGKGALPMIANLGQTRRFRTAARTNLADVALRQLDYKNSFKLYEQAAKGAKDDKRLDLMWPAQLGMGRSQWAQATQEKDAKKSTKLRESALVNFQDAITTVEALRAGSLRADESSTIFLSTTKDVFDDAANAFAEMALLSAPASGNSAEAMSGKALDYAAAAFTITEQSRARSLLDLLSETNAFVTEGLPPELLKRKQDNLDRQQEIAEALTGISLAADSEKKPSDLESALEKLQTEFEEIENQIRTASPRYASLTAGKPLSLAEVQSGVLDDQTVLLEYSLGRDTSYLWAVTKSAVSLYKLPARQVLDKLATDLRAQLIPSKLQRRIVGIDVMADSQRGLGVSATPFAEDAAAFVTASSALYKAALEPAGTALGEKRLLIVADGALNYVPFEALVKSPESADYSSLPYLIKSNEVIYAPSASVVGVIKQQNNNRTGRAMLILADPVFNSNDARAKGAAASANEGDTRGLGIQSALADVTGQDAAATAGSTKMQGLPLARLAGTRTEAEQIVKLAKTSGAQADMWLDLDANEGNIETRDVTKYRVVHIATHGLLNAERPQFTGLVLSLVGNKTGDGFLRTDEVFNLRLGSPLVMLSACETGLGKEKRGEGVMGLTRAFMYAGAPTVGVSLWSVADKSTAELMTDFYKRLLGSSAAEPSSVSPSAAMRDAQLAMIAGKKYSAPFYWAPFVLVGDWR